MGAAWRGRGRAGPGFDVHQALATRKRQNKFVESQGIRNCEAKERGARQPHERLLYYVNVNRTSLDHLLLGRNADIDKSVEWSDYNAGIGGCQSKRFLDVLGSGTRKPVTGNGVNQDLN